MNVIGVDEVVNVSSVFDVRGGGVFISAFARGARNFYERTTLTVFGFVVMATLHIAAPPPNRGDPTFTEPTPISDDDSQWKASVSGLKALIGDIREGAHPSFARELSGLATEALASAQDRKPNVDAWAKALACEVAELDD
jgi:hypothetical protein